MVTWLVAAVLPLSSVPVQPLMPQPASGTAPLSDMISPAT